MPAPTKTICFVYVGAGLIFDEACIIDKRQRIAVKMSTFSSVCELCASVKSAMLIKAKQAP